MYHNNTRRCVYNCVAVKHNKSGHIVGRTLKSLNKKSLVVLDIS